MSTFAVQQVLCLDVFVDILVNLTPNTINTDEYFKVGKYMVVHKSVLIYTVLCSIVSNV